MARYAERNKFMQNLKTNKHGETTVSEVAIAFEKAETEVVPKSEFETLQRKYELAVAEREANVKAFTEELEKANAEIEQLVQDGTRLAQENETLKDNNEHLAVMLEEAKSELVILKSLITQKEEEAYNRGYADAQSEVNKIFEEIEKIILENTYPYFTKEGKPCNIWKPQSGYDALAELKKKFNKQCPDCKHFVGCEKAVWHGLCEEYDKNTTEEKK